MVERRGQWFYFCLLFLGFLTWSMPALFWGTQKVEHVEKYNLHPDENTTLLALDEANYLGVHWNGGGYFNAIKLVHFIAKQTLILDGLKRFYDLQGNGPILLTGRLLSLLSVFGSGLCVFGLLNSILKSKAYAYLGQILYLIQPAVQVSGHYMRAHIVMDLFLLLFFTVLMRFFESDTEHDRQKYTRWQFVLAGLMFSFRYPFVVVIGFPLYFLWKSRDYRRIIRYSFLAAASAFAVNPFFFIHLRTSLLMARSAPHMYKMNQLTASHSVAEFLTILNPVYEVKQIFFKVLPNSTGSFFWVILLLVAVIGYLAFAKRDRSVNCLLIFMSYYFFMWVVWGQTAGDGLSRFSLPVMILLAVMVPLFLYLLSERNKLLQIPALVVTLFLCAGSALFSSELLFQMSGNDPRILADRALREEPEICFVDRIGWDWGFFSEMKQRVKIIPKNQLDRYPGKVVLLTDASVHSRNPYERIPELKLVAVIRPRQLFDLWPDSSYLHDYRYFSPTVYIFRISNIHREKVKTKLSPGIKKELRIRVPGLHEINNIVLQLSTFQHGIYVAIDVQSV